MDMKNGPIKLQAYKWKEHSTYRSKSAQNDLTRSRSYVKVGTNYIHKEMIFECHAQYSI